MKKRRYLYRWIAVIAFIALGFTLVIEANVTKPDQKDDVNGEKRADIININTLKSFGDLERKEVPFLHDAHTDALKKAQKSCDTCHFTDEISGKEVLSLKFKRLEDTTKQEVMDIYHTNCIGCHEEMSVAGDKTGPVELCGECHKENPEITSSHQPIEFDKSLHYSHIELNGEDCSVCHHDDKKEGSCRYCHTDDSSENAISMKKASHLSCIGCHKEISGPVKCNACHDINEQQKIEKSEDVPRLMQGQQDVVLMGMNLQDSTTGEFSTKMNPVPFNHKAHEEYQDTCRVCHHSEIGSCSKSCHTLEGSEKGNMITSEQAMHKLDSERSCLGCHEVNKSRKECSGCHGIMEKSSADNACLKCHTKMPEISGEEDMKPESIASMLLDSVKNAPDTFDDNDIPEIVTIDGLSHQYGAVELPHRQIIDSLMLDTKNNSLASYFHNGKETLCLGCHHNSPASVTPPNCASCHSKSSDDSTTMKPDLKVAYHQQCMGCHDRMGIEIPKSTSCVDCHKVIGVNKLYD